MLAVNKYNMKALATQGSHRAKLVLAITKHPERVLATILFLNTLANVSISAITSALVVDMVASPHEEIALVLVTIGLTIVLLIFAEFAPKTIAARHADRLALLLIQPLRLMMALSRPVVVVGSSLARLIVRPLGVSDAGDSKLSDLVLRSLIDETSTEVSPTSDRNRMLRGVLSLSDLAVKSVTIPRTEVTALPLDATAEEVLQTIRTTGYSRIPVFRENLDNVVGILHSKDVLPSLLEHFKNPSRSKESLSLTRIMRKPLFIPDTAKVDVTLKYMQKNHIHLAVVIDEHGGVEGVVTLEDLLEQIVGEIQDEHDFELDAIRHLADGSWLIDADISVRDLNKRLKLSLPESSHYATLAGFLLAQSGRLLAKNDWVYFPPCKFSVIETEGHRLVKVRLERNLTESASEEMEAVATSQSPKFDSTASSPGKSSR